MKKVKQLLQEWSVNAHSTLTPKKIGVHLRVYDVARVRALVDLFPGRTEEQIISELLSAALDEVEEALPYIKGDRVIAEDEFGDPIYEDAGPTPVFKSATQKHEQLLGREQEQSKVTG